MHRHLAVAVLAVVSLSGCGRPTVDVAGRPVSEGSPSPVTPDLLAEGLLRGVPDTCRLVEEVGGQTAAVENAELGAAVSSGIDPSVDRGPLVGVDEETGGTVVAATLFGDDGRESDTAVWEVRPTDDGYEIVAVNEVATTISDFPAELMGNPITSGAAEATDCSWVAADRSRPDPPEPEPSMRPDLLVLEPATVRPGEIVELHYPGETMRGIAFHLDRETDGGWETLYLLTSDGNDGEPSWVPVGTEGYGWPDVGVAGAGPDRVLIPDEAEPGNYRICTANAGDEFCAPLEIVAP